MFKECVENVRNNVPLVHNITNYVTVNDVANVLLACGGSPIMSDDIDDVEDITSICGGLNINIGTLNKNTIPSMFAAGKKANELGHVVLLDPVGAGASKLRTNTANAKGVDVGVCRNITDKNLDDTISKLKSFSKATGSIIAVTGAIDLVCDSEKCYVIRNGRAEMSSITGTGCQLSGLMTAFLVANPENKLEAAAAAVCTMGLAGEIAWSRMSEGDGNSTYRNRIIDAIYNMDGETLEKGAKYEVK